MQALRTAAVMHAGGGTRAVAAGAVGVALALGACGGSETPQPPTPTAGAVQTSERDILNTVDRLQQASRRGDGAAICREVFTARLAGSIARAARRPCATTVRRTLFSPDTSISVQRDVRVAGQRATAVIREQNGHVSTLALRRENGRWRIDSITPGSKG